MLFPKKKGQVLEHPTLQTKHKDGSPVVSPILAPTCPYSKSDTNVLPENKVVLTGVDTLVVTAGGTVAPSKWLVEHQSIWKEYQDGFSNAPDDNNYLTDEIAGTWWSIRPYGIKQYGFILDNPEIGHIRIWNVNKWSSGARTKQQVYLDLRSSWLHQHHTDFLFDAVSGILSHFFEYTSIQQLNIQVSRIDLHCDITNGSSFLTESQVQNTISRSKYRNYFLSDDTITLTPAELDLLEGGPTYNKSPQKLIDASVLDKLLLIAKNQISIGYDNLVHKREIETAYFGKKTSDVWGKIYDKTKCCKSKSDLDTPMLWLENGWNKSDTVVRVEFSMRRAFIKEMNNGSYVLLDAFIKNKNEVWDWMTTKWMRMVDEVKRNNIQTSPVSKFWSVVQSSFSSATNKIIRKRNHAGKINQLLNQGVGCLKKVVAMGMRTNNDEGFSKAVGEAITKVLHRSYSSGEIYNRRVKLGLADTQSP